MLLALLQGISFGTAPLLSFGPFKIFVLSSALAQGWRRSLPLALTPLLADMPVIALIWLVLRGVPDWSLDVLRILGGLFYLYLAYSLYRRSKQPVNSEAMKEAPRRTFWQAVTAIWITPQVYINWSVIGVPAALAYAQESPYHALAFFVGFYALWVPGLAAQIVIFGKAGGLNQGFRRTLTIGASLLLIGFGLYQGWLGLSALLTR